MVMVIKAMSGLIVVCASFAVREVRVIAVLAAGLAVSVVVSVAGMHVCGGVVLFLAMSGAVAILLHRQRFVNRPEELVDGATYEFLHDGGSTCVRTFFTDYDRAEKHDKDSFTWSDCVDRSVDLSADIGVGGCSRPGVRSFQKHLPSGEPCQAGAWQNACNFFGPNGVSLTARIRRIR